MEIKHHDFFNVYYPIYIEDEDFTDAFLEEAYLYYGKEMTPSFNYDDKGRTAFDIVLFPISHIRFVIKTSGNDFEKSRKLNEIIDDRFVEILIHIAPIYKLDLLLDYHFYKYSSSKEDFFKHLLYVIIPLSKTKIDKLKELPTVENDNLPLPSHIEELIENWINSKNINKKNPIDWTKIGVYIAFIGLAVTIITLFL